MGVTAAETDGTSQDTEALYREHGAAVARLCRSLLRDRAEAEDATQQVFLSAHRALLNGAAPREPLAWLIAVARNECYARFRQREAAPVPSPETPHASTADASAHALRARELASVWDEIGRMPPAQREAFLLREIRGLSYDQLADELSLSRPSVRSLLLRARTRLRQRLGDVAAGVGGAPWVQGLLRFVAGGDGASPVPAAAKAAAVGVGALALAGGGSLVARHPSRAAHAGARHRVPVRARRDVAPIAVAVAPKAVDVRTSSRERPLSRDDGVREPHSGGSGSHQGSGEITTSSGSSPSSGGHDGSNDSTATAGPATDGQDGGGSSSSGPDSGSTSTSSSDSGSDGGSGTSGSSSGSDGGSTTTTTTATTTTSSGSDGHDGGSHDGHGG
jgi:RNA polymerase sigma-70 factor (ECF subfamily)